MCRGPCGVCSDPSPKVVWYKPQKHEEKQYMVIFLETIMLRKRRVSKKKMITFKNTRPTCTLVWCFFGLVGFFWFLLLVFLLVLLFVSLNIEVFSLGDQVQKPPLQRPPLLRVRKLCETRWVSGGLLL